MALRWSRAIAIPVAGLVLGLAWNAWSGRGIALRGNAFLQEGDAIEEVEVQQAKARLDKGALFLDARPRAFYEMSHIPGSYPLPEDDFDKAFAVLEDRLRRSFDIVVYCSGYGCEASHLVTRRLAGKGIRAAILHEGWPAWTDAGFPVKEGAQP